MHKIIFTSYNFPKKKIMEQKSFPKKEIEWFVGDRALELLRERWLASALVDRAPQKLEGEREYHGIQKRKLLSICRKPIVGWPPGAR